MYIKRRITGFSIIRIPFLLEPNYNPNKTYIETNRQRLIRKWGGIEQWEQQKIRHQLKERGLEVNIQHFNLNRLASNTMNSHRLIQYISQYYNLMISECIYDTLNQYHFVDGHSLNDIPKLANVVANTLQELYTTKPSMFMNLKNDGNQEQQQQQQRTTTTTTTLLLPPLTEEQIIDYLNSNEGYSNIQNALSILEQMNINGIPTFIIDGGNIILNGAVHSSTFVKTFRTIEQRGYLLHNEPIFQNILNIPSTIIQHGSYCINDE